MLTRLKIKILKSYVIKLTFRQYFFNSSEYIPSCYLKQFRPLSISTPPTALSTEVRYEKMMEIFGETGHLCRTVAEIEMALKKALTVTDKPSIINILIDPQSNRKPQKFNWLTESKL